MSEKGEHHIMSYNKNLIVLAILLVLTAITVSVSTIDLKGLTVTVAIIIATVKAVIVALYFMHLRYEKKILGIFMLITMLVFISVLLFTFLDYGFRT